MAETSTPLNNLTIRRLTKTVLDAKQSVNANEMIFVDPEFTGGKLLATDNTGNFEESSLATADISDAISKKHEHTNKTQLDKIPSTLGTAGQVLTVGSDSNMQWANVPTELPSVTGNASKVLAVNSGATGVEWVTPSSGVSNHDFTHVANTTVSTSTTTITFAANQRGSQMITVSADIGITFDVRNLSDNYLWIKNTGSSDIDVTISSVVNDQTTISNVYIPSDGISVPAGSVCEIGILRNADGAFITSRNDLTL